MAFPKSSGVVWCLMIVWLVKLTYVMVSSSWVSSFFLAFFWICLLLLALFECAVVENSAWFFVDYSFWFVVCCVLNLGIIS